MTSTALTTGQTPLVPESPRWLLMSDNPARAVQAEMLIKAYARTPEEETESWRKIKEDVEVERGACVELVPTPGTPVSAGPAAVTDRPHSSGVRQHRARRGWGTKISKSNYSRALLPVVSCALGLGHVYWLMESGAQSHGRSLRY